MNNFPIEITKIILDQCSSMSGQSLTLQLTCRLFLSATSPLIPKDLCIALAKRGHFNLIVWAFPPSHPLPLQVFYYAARFNDRLFLQYLNNLSSITATQASERSEAPKSLAQGAARGGHLDLLKELREQGYPLDDIVCSSAAAGGHLEVLQWAVSSGCNWTHVCPNVAARKGHLKVLQWIESTGVFKDADNSGSAVQGGQLEVLKWQLENGRLLSKGLVEVAAVNGNLEIFNWLIEIGYPIGYDPISPAVEGGNIEIIQSLINRGFVFGKQHSFVAVYCGRVEVLQWMKDRGYNFQDELKEICHSACEFGSSKVAEWAVSQGCPLKKEFLVSAYQNEQKAIIDWILEQDPELGSETPDEYDHEMLYDDWEFSIFIREEEHDPRAREIFKWHRKKMSRKYLTKVYSLFPRTYYSPSSPISQIVGNFVINNPFTPFIRPE